LLLALTVTNTFLILRAAIVGACALAALDAAAQATAPPSATCEALRARIEQRIRANGIALPKLTVVDAAASAPGQLVGTCEQSAKKVMYEREGGGPAKPAKHAVITECKDGTVVRDGAPCPKP
jgi:hypothetical protein